MRNYYSDPTGNAAIGAVDREISRMEKEAKLSRRVQKQRERRLKRYEDNRKQAKRAPEDKSSGALNFVRLLKTVVRRFIIIIVV